MRAERAEASVAAAQGELVDITKRCDCVRGVR